MCQTVMLYKHIKDGTVVFPRNWIELSFDEALESPYVGVVETFNGDNYGVPHFYFHSKTPINEISDDVELMIFEECCKASTAFSEAYDHDLRKVKDPDTGELLYGETVETMTIAGIFSIAAEDEDEHHPYGAMIIKEYL